MEAEFFDEFVFLRFYDFLMNMQRIVHCILKYLKEVLEDLISSL